MSDDSHTDQGASDGRSPENKPKDSKSLTSTPSKRELKVRIYINGILLREEVVYDIRGGWSLNQFTNAVQEEAERGFDMTDEDLEAIRNLNAGTSVIDLVATGQEATTPPLKSAQLPKDNQIDIDKLLTDLHVTGRYDDSMFTPRDIRDIVEETKVALATAIREATPGQLTEFHGQGTMQLEAKVHQAAIDRFLTNLKDIGLEV